jgi:hypothetical protein
MKFLVCPFANLFPLHAEIGAKITAAARKQIGVMTRPPQ